MRRAALMTLVLLFVCANVAAAEEVRIGGRVLIAGGSALAEAQVRLLPAAAPEREALDVTDGVEVEAATGTLTDRNGRFSLGVPNAGLWRVRIDAPGFVPLEMRLTPLIETLELVDALLEPDSGLVSLSAVHVHHEGIMALWGCKCPSTRGKKWSKLST